MKKRIISLILVAVMAVLTLAGCAYSYAKDDMSQYAKFDKAAFEAALASITIEDGDFAIDERDARVADAIAKALAAKADTTDKKTEGTPAASDTVYYCYYVTATIKDVEYLFLTENMKVEEASKMDGVQLGINFFDDDVLTAIEEKLEGFVFSADTVYSQETSSETKIADGDVVFISYTREYEQTEGTDTKTVKETASAHRVVIDKDDAFLGQLIGKSVGTTISGIKDVTEGDAKGKYTGVKVEWIAKGNEAFTVEDVTYDVSTNKPTTLYTGSEKNQDLKDVTLTYHIYPAFYVETPELSADNILNEIYAPAYNSSDKSYSARLTLAVMANILFGDDYTDGDEDEKKALLDKYKFTKDDAELSLTDFVTAINNAQNDAEKAESELDTAKAAYDKTLEALENAKKALDDAEKAVAEATEANSANPNEENQTKLENATKDRDTKKTAYDTALKNFKADRLIYDGTAETEKTPVELGEDETYTEGEKGKKEALKKAEEKLATLTAELYATVGADVEGEGEAADKGKARIVEGYEYNVTYKNLEATYNADIADKVAAYVYDAIIANVKVSSYPKKAVKNAYKYLIENYEYCFYENKTVSGSNVSTSSDSNYKKYGDFETFLVEYAVPTDLEVKVENYDQALAAINKEAERHVAEIISIYIVSEAYGKVVSDKDYKAYLEEDNNEYYEDAYGENFVRSAYQFDTLLDYILESEEKEDGKATVTEYKNKLIGTITLVEELPEEETEEETETE